MLVLAAAHLAAGSPNHEGLTQAGELGLALLLSVVVGVEREIKNKSAGLRTHALVGVGAGVFMLISKYGFRDVLVPGQVIVDPSRVAAQIVTGIGFIGAGLIFVRRDGVRGLTTAAGVWVTAAIGAAAGAGLPVVAVLAKAAYLIVAVGFPALDRLLPGSLRATAAMRVRYRDDGGMLREVLRVTAAAGFAVDRVATSPASGDEKAGRESGGGRAGPAAGAGAADPGGAAGPGPGATRLDRVSAGGNLMTGAAGPAWATAGPDVELVLYVRGKGSVPDLAATLTELPGVSAVATGRARARGAE